MPRSPSIVPQDPDHDTYIVLDASGVWVGRGFHETAVEDDRQTLIRDLLDGSIAIRCASSPSTPPRDGRAL